MADLRGTWMYILPIRRWTFYHSTTPLTLFIFEVTWSLYVFSEQRRSGLQTRRVFCRVGSPGNHFSYTPVSVTWLVLKAHRGDFEMKNIHWGRNFNHLVKKTSKFFHWGESKIRSFNLGLVKNALSNNDFCLGCQKFSAFARGRDFHCSWLSFLTGLLTGVDLTGPLLRGCSHLSGKKVNYYKGSRFIYYWGITRCSNNCSFLLRTVESVSRSKIKLWFQRYVL